MQKIFLKRYSFESFERKICPAGCYINVMEQVKKDLPRMHAIVNGVKITNPESIMHTDSLVFFQQGCLAPALKWLCRIHKGKHVVDAGKALKCELSKDVVEIEKSFNVLDSSLNQISSACVYIVYKDDTVFQYMIIDSKQV